MRTLLLLSFLFLVNNVMSQSSPKLFNRKNNNNEHHVIIIDAKTGRRVMNSNEVPYGSSVSFEFLNVNPLVVKSEVKNTPITFETQVPVLLHLNDNEILSSLKLPTIDESSLSKIMDDIPKNKFVFVGNKIDTVNLYNKKAEEFMKTSKEITKKVADLQNQYMIVEGAEKKKEIADSISNLISQLNKAIIDFNDKYASIQSNLRSINKALNESKKTFGSVINKINDLQLQYAQLNEQLRHFIDVKKSTDELQIKFINNYIELVKKLQRISFLMSIEDQLRKKLKDPVIEKYSTCSYLESYLTSLTFSAVDSSNFRNKIGELRSSLFIYLDEINNHYLELSLAYDELSKTLKDEKFNFKGKLTDETNKTALVFDSSNIRIERKKYFQENYDHARKQVAKLNNDSIRNIIIGQVSQSLYLIESIYFSNFSISEGPYEVKSDVSVYKPTIVNEKKTVLKEFDQVTLYAKGGLKVDVSTGYLLSFKADDDFSTVKNTTGDIVGFKKNTNEQLTHSVGALFNMYKRSPAGIKLGGSLGISLPTDGKFNFYAGISAFFFGNSRVVLTTGIAMVRVKRLNQALLSHNKSDNIYYFISGNEYSDPSYSNVYRPGVFLGLTYNIANISGK